MKLVATCCLDSQVKYWSPSTHVEKLVQESIRWPPFFGAQDSRPSKFFYPRHRLFSPSGEKLWADKHHNFLTDAMFLLSKVDARRMALSSNFFTLKIRAIFRFFHWSKWLIFPSGPNSSKFSWLRCKLVYSFRLMPHLTERNKYLSSSNKCDFLFHREKIADFSWHHH